jgi:transketolase
VSRELPVLSKADAARRRLFAYKNPELRQALLKLLAIKDSDIRILTLEQCRDAVDNGLHAGGAFSATIPLVALFYGGFMRIDVANPTRLGQDLFTLSKGHAVAALASIYAELGYFDRHILKNSRSYNSILNGHPGPLLPGIHLATGPMGQGLGVAQGFAIVGRTTHPRFDAYCIVGDGELQEGPIWETLLYSGQSHLDNLCVLVDRNNGQLDIHDRMVFPMPELRPVFEAFGWQVHSVDATQYDGVFAALEHFRFAPRNGKPTAIICNATKGYGSFSDFFNKHKVVASPAVVAQEIAMQLDQRRARVDEFLKYLEELDGSVGAEEVQDSLLDAAREMRLEIAGSSQAVRAITGPVVTTRVPSRDKRIRYDANLLPQLDSKKEYSAAEVVTAGMKVFACDPRVVSIDSDLATTSGLQAGVAAADQQRALNAGVAEANMMLMGESFAALGYNAWVSTFCPFFDWKVLRRIAVGQQERLESIQSPEGWLSDGHGLDLTFLATAANFETRTNGATHMGNDDNTTFQAVAHLQIIDVSCPQQMLGIMKWIMGGNRGLVYVRVMRTPSAVLYGGDFTFEFGNGYVLRQSPADTACLISSGRGVHEALAAAALCERSGVNVRVVDMPSIDQELLCDLLNSGRLLVFAEQNNGYIWQNFLHIVYTNRSSIRLENLRNVATINTLDANSRPQFIHSGTYEELVDAFGLSPAAIARTVCDRLGDRT